MANLQRLLHLGSLALNPARVVQDALDAARHTAILIVCALVAVLILLPAVGCAAAGLWIYVQHKLGLVWAAFMTAAAFLIAALIILLIGVIASKRRRSQEPQRDEPLRQINAIAAAVPAALTGLAGPRHISAASRRFFNDYKGTALLSAAVIGLILGQDVFRIRPRRK